MFTHIKFDLTYMLESNIYPISNIIKYFKCIVQYLSLQMQLKQKEKKEKEKSSYWSLDVHSIGGQNSYK